MRTRSPIISIVGLLAGDDTEESSLLLICADSFGSSLTFPTDSLLSLDASSASSCKVTPFSKALLTCSSSVVFESWTTLLLEVASLCSSSFSPLFNCSFSFCSSSFIILSISCSLILLSESARGLVDSSGDSMSLSSSEKEALVIDIRTLLGLFGLASSSTNSFSMVSA